MANGRPSLVDEIMPAQGMPLGGMTEEDIEVEQIEEPTGMIEEEDGSVVLNFEKQMQEQLQTEPDANLAEVLDERELMRIANDLLGLYKDDRASRDDWEDAYVNGLGLLGIKYEEREEPFRGSSGVTHPLIAEAVTQFQAQAYKELLPSSGPVRTQIIGVSIENFHEYPFVFTKFLDTLFDFITIPRTIIVLFDNPTFLSPAVIIFFTEKPFFSNPPCTTLFLTVSKLAKRTIRIVKNG